MSKPVRALDSGDGAAGACGIRRQSSGVRLRPLSSTGSSIVGSLRRNIHPCTSGSSCFPSRTMAHRLKTLQWLSWAVVSKPGKSPSRDALRAHQRPFA